MKSPVLTAVAGLAIALGALAQGSIDLDNSAGTYGLIVNGQGHWYSGTFGLEVWELDGQTIPAGPSIAGFPFSGVAAYNGMVAAGFKLQKTYFSQKTFAPASFVLGECDMPDVSPRGGTVVVGLAAWNTAATSWNAMLASADANTRAGVVEFVNATSDYTMAPPPTPPGITGWDTSAGMDLVMTAIPEPGTFALAGLGVAILWTFRRRN